jgi:hypothetical protein
MSYQFVYSDAGRSDSRRPKQKNDCTVRALSLALGMQYDEAYDLLAEAGRRCSSKFDFSAWIERQSFAKKIAFPAVKGQPRMNPVEFARQFPKGLFIVKVSKHILLFRDGVAFDDYKVGDGRCIYTAWEINQATSCVGVQKGGKA